MSEVKPSFQGEMMLAGWTETHNGGCKVTFWLPSPEDLDVFRGMTVRKGNTAGQRFMGVLVEIPDGEIEPKQTEQPKEKRPPNYLARKMMIDGYFRNPHLWEALHKAGIYTHEDHKDWVRELSCVVYENFRQTPCSGDIVPHHLQTATLPAAGKGAKNPRKVSDFYTVPVCAYHHSTFCHGDSVRREREELKELCIEITAERIKDVVKDRLGLVSLSEINIDMLHVFEMSLDLPTFVYREES